MARTTIAVGAALILLGLGGFIGSGGTAVTALIPAFFGVPLAILGAVARNERARKHAMHVAVMLGILGCLGAARGFFKLPALLAGTAARPLAVVMQLAMFAVCATFVALSVRSFMRVRRASASSPPLAD